MKTSPIEFFKQVRQEANKVTWPSRKETLVTGAMVFVMVLITGLFFLVVDQALSFAVRMLLGVRG
jgi:preprotein translocase subunit SecE